MLLPMEKFDEYVFEGTESLVDKMKQFLLIQSQKQQSQKQQSGGVVNQKQSSAPPAKSIPEYSIGKPICTGKNVCYLFGNDAYKKK